MEGCALYIMQRVASATSDLRLPSRWKSIATVPWQVQLIVGPADGGSNCGGGLSVYIRPTVQQPKVTHLSTNRAWRKRKSARTTTTPSHQLDRSISEVDYLLSIAETEKKP